jgi:pimeloyl-ACP methyl ester carboxylesterase
LGCTYAEPGADIERQRDFSLAQFGGSMSSSGEMKVDLGAIDPLSFFQHLLPAVFNTDFIERELPKLMQVFAGALQYGFSMEAILAQVAAVMSHRTTDRLHQIQSPTLVITGDADRLIPPANSDVLARHIPGAKLVKIPGGSHGFNFETPEVFNRAVLDFLASVKN